MIYYWLNKIYCGVVELLKYCIDSKDFEIEFVEIKYCLSHGVPRFRFAPLDP